MRTYEEMRNTPIGSTICVDGWALPAVAHTLTKMVGAPVGAVWIEAPRYPDGKARADCPHMILPKGLPGSPRFLLTGELTLSQAWWRVIENICDVDGEQAKLKPLRLDYQK